MLLQSDTTQNMFSSWFDTLTPLKVYLFYGFSVWHLLKYIHTCFCRLAPLQLCFLHGFTVWDYLKYTLDRFYSVILRKVYFDLVLMWFYSLIPLKLLTWFHNLTRLKVYSLNGFRVWDHWKYTFDLVLQSDTT